MSKSAVVEVVDGRRQRSERSKRAIIEAGLSLIDDGILAPTALQISQRAGVGIRSFFRHFEDMETLFAAVDNYTRDAYTALFIGGNREGSFEERLEHAIQRYAKAYKKLGNVILSSQVQSLRSDVVRKSFANSQRALRGDLDQWLPELKKIPKKQREAIDAIASFDMWHRLSFQQGLSKNASAEIMIGLIKSVISSK